MESYGEVKSCEFNIYFIYSISTPRFQSYIWPFGNREIINIFDLLRNNDKYLFIRQGHSCLEERPIAQYGRENLIQLTYPCDSRFMDQVIVRFPCNAFEWKL